MAMKSKCLRCGGRGEIKKWRANRFAGWETCPACQGTGVEFESVESLREFRKRLQQK